MRISINTDTLSIKLQCSRIILMLQPFPQVRKGVKRGKTRQSKTKVCGAVVAALKRGEWRAQMNTVIASGVFLTSSRLQANKRAGIG
jgi:hypothetical protein